MATIFETNDAVFFVGGRGVKWGDVDAGGGATKDAWEGALGRNLANVMGTNGEPLSDSSAWNGSKTACTVTSSGGGKVLITKTGAFASVKEGLVANVKFAGIYGDGRYRVNSNCLTDDTIEIELTYSTNTTCDVKVGGAFNRLQSALDNTDAGASTPHNVDILTNKSEAFIGYSDRIDVDVGGGNGSAGTWKRIIGIDDNGDELDEGSYVLVDGNGQSCHVFKIMNVQCIEIRHIYAKHSLDTYYGFYITGSSYCQGFLLKDCKSSGCKYGVYSDTYYIRGITIIGGHYSSAAGTALYFTGCRWVYVLGAELTGSSAGALVDGDVIGILLIDGCVLHKTGNYVGGVYSDNWDTFLLISNCVFYNIDDCIRLNDAESRLIQYNNIFVLHTASTGKIINRMAGAIKYSDYSCAWASDGAPSASGRWGQEGKPANAIEEDPQFVDADSSDFRPRNPKVLRGGRRDRAGNATEMGAVLQKYRFEERAKTANFGRLQIIR
jgi:hypothetical protein